MKHKAWFRLAVRIVGLAMVAFHLPSTISLTLSLVFEILQISFGYPAIPYSPMAGSFFGSGEWPEFLMLALPNIATVAIGIYLAMGGKRLVDLCYPLTPKSCTECGYSLAHRSNITRCPECGMAVRVE